MVLPSVTIRDTYDVVQYTSDDSMQTIVWLVDCNFFLESYHTGDLLTWSWNAFPA